MEYGLRRYEASQRLAWLLFFLACLGLAYWYSINGTGGPPAGTSRPAPFQPEVLKSIEFWLDLRWIKGEPFGRFMTFLVTVAFVFLAGRCLGLILQEVGKNLVAYLLRRYVGIAPERPEATPRPTGRKQASSFPPEALIRKADNLVLLVLFHPFRRLKVMLNSPRGVLSLEGLAERERRISETDWDILWGSWTPFRWLVRFLPLVALAQTGWLLQQALLPALSGQRDLNELIGPAFSALFPLLQVIFLCLCFSVASALLKRLESLYLSGVDALLYDQFIARMPYQSSDTMILLEALQRNFQELHAALRRLERSLGEGKTGPERERP